MPAGLAGRCGTQTALAIAAVLRGFKLRSPSPALGDSEGSSLCAGLLVCGVAVIMGTNISNV